MRALFVIAFSPRCTLLTHIFSQSLFSESLATKMKKVKSAGGRIHTTWIRGLITLGLEGVLIAGIVVASLFSQEVGAETQRTGTPLSNSIIRTIQADQATKITSVQEVALVWVRKMLKEAWEVANSIVPPTKLPGTTVPENSLTELERYKNRLLRDTELTRFWAGDFSTVATSREYWDLTIAQIRYGRLQDAAETATNKSNLSFFFSSAQTLVILKLLSDAGDLAGAMQVAEALAQRTHYGGPARKQHEAELMAYMARRQAEAGKPEARETLARAIEVIRSNKNAPYRTAPYFQHGGWAAIGCAQVAMGDRTGGEESMRHAIKAAASLPREEYEGDKGRAVNLIGRAAAESGLKSASEEAFQEALRLARNIAQSSTRAQVMAKVAVSQLQSGDRVGGQRTLDEAIQFADSLPSYQEQLRARGVIVAQQIEAGERTSAEATVERMRRLTEALTDVKEQEADRKAFQSWEAQLMTPQVALDRAYALEGHDEEQATALAYAAYLVVHSKEPVSTPEILQRLSKTAASLLAQPLPNNRKRADQYLGSLARVQVVADGTSPALQTAGRISDSSSQKNSYLGLLSLLTKKKDVVGAKQVVALLRVKEEDLPSGDSGDTLGDKVKNLARVQAEIEDTSQALQWARQQVSPYAKVQGLLGVALGLMERIAIYDLRQHLPASMAINKGARDTLTLGCSTL